MVVLITGASSDIGRCIALEFAKEKYDIILNYNGNYDKVINLKKQLDKMNINSYICKADISSEEEVKNMYDFIESKYAKIDVLINCASISLDNNIEEKTKKEFMRVLEVNVFGTFLVTRHALRLLDNGTIINISSTDAIDTYNEYNIDYSASKAAINSLTKTFSYVYPNVKIISLMPLWVNTSSIREMNQDFLKKELIRTKQTRLLEPSEVALKVISLIKDDTLSGSIIRMEE